MQTNLVTRYYEWWDNGSVSNSWEEGSIESSYNSNPKVFLEIREQLGELLSQTAGSLSNYTAWALAKGLVPGVDDDPLNDAENGGTGDGMVNLAEYAFGGNPLADDAATYLPTSEFIGVDTWNYVYRRRNDHDFRNLAYELLYDEDLVADPSWPLTNLWTDGFGTIDSEFEMVTNTIPTSSNDTAFLKLEISVE